MATFKMSDAVAQVQMLLKESGDTSDNALLDAINTPAMVAWATREYSIQRPNDLAVDLVGDGTDFVALPEDWDEGIGVIDMIEYPVESTPPFFLDKRTYEVYQRPTGQVIRMLFGAIVAGTYIRVFYQGMRSFGTDVKDTTVLDIDFDAVCALAASRAADLIASQYARTHEPILHADIMDHGQSKVQAWQAIAKRWQTVWDLHLASVHGPATGTGHWDTQLSYDPEWSSTVGRDPLTHTRWGR